MDMQSLCRALEGRAIQPSDRAYEAARRSLSWNLHAPASRPAAIVQVASEDDVVAAVRFARDQGLRVAISGGGHSLCGAPPGDGAVLIDLARLDHVSIDAAARRARVQPVARNRDLSRQLAAHALAFPYGHCSSVALSGYLLSGGFGWNSGQWRPACFSIEAVDVVLADGTLVTASDSQNAEVLWAARGGGVGFFGIVTRYHLLVYPQPHTILTSAFVYPLECAPRIGAWLSEQSATQPCNLEIMLALTRAPAHIAAQCAGSGGRACVVNAAAFAESEDEARAVLGRLEACPAIDDCYDRMLNQPSSFDALFDGMDQLFPSEHRYLAHSVGSERSVGDLLAALEPHVRRMPSPQSLILCPILAPPPTGAPMPPPAAFSMAPRTFAMAYAIWNDAGADGANHAWHQAVVDTLEPHTTCYYIGETDITARPERTARCFSPANWQRLQSLRRQYDPDELFRTPLSH